MEKIVKFTSIVTKREGTITISEELNKLTGKLLAPRKLEDANKILRQLKTPLPK